jgi:hypothetical protein
VLLQATLVAFIKVYTLEALIVTPMLDPMRLLAAKIAVIKIVA